jgi:hypothetical protein
MATDPNPATYRDVRRQAAEARDSGVLLDARRAVWLPRFVVVTNAPGCLTKPFPDRRR